MVRCERGSPTKLDLDAHILVARPQPRGDVDKTCGILDIYRRNTSTSRHASQSVPYADNETQRGGVVCSPDQILPPNSEVVLCRAPQTSGDVFDETT